MTKTQYLKFLAYDLKSLKDIDEGIDQEELITKMLKRYNSRNASNCYVIAFRWFKTIYTVEIPELTKHWVRFDVDSRRGLKLRLRLTRQDKDYLVTSDIAKPLVEEKHLREIVANSIYNKGEIIEKILTEKEGISWEKDNKCFNIAGDIEVGSKKMQVKYENASIITLKTLLKV